MSDPEYLKCSCQNCGEHLEFPANSVGEQIACPHCGAQTKLDPTETLPGTPRSKVGIIAGSILVILALVATAMALYFFKMRKVPDRGSIPVITTGTNAAVEKYSLELHEFQIGPISLKKAENGGLVHAVGTVKNDTDRQRFGVKITLDLLNAEGAKIGSASDYLAILEPHQDWQFKALLTEPKAVAAKLTNIEEQK